MDRIELINSDAAFGAVTLKNKDYPESNNMALHVCISPADVMINRNRLSDEIQVPLDHWVLPWQKHTANVYRVTSKDMGKGAYDADTSIMNTDALYTTEKGLLIGVFTADCVGILLVDETTPCLCVIHSGWKGTSQAITQKTVKKLIQDNLLHPNTTKAWFSPSIQYKSLEVGMEVVELIRKLDFDTSPFIKTMPHDKAFIDNQGLNIQMLKNLGILKENIFPSQLDTKTETDICFSYRNDKKTGEHFTFGILK